MAYTKIYKYKILQNSEEKYRDLQERAAVAYRKHAELEFLYFHDVNDNNLKTEVIRFFDKNISHKLGAIDNDPEILRLFHEFKKEILDETFPIEEQVLMCDDTISASGKLHHVEIYCSNLEKSLNFWSWFLELFGYHEFQKWEHGVSYKLGDTYLVFVQADDKHLGGSYHRCKPGLNHLAFHASSRKMVDEILKALKLREINILYSYKFPNNDSYAIYFEDPERIKVEVVAP